MNPQKEFLFLTLVHNDIKDIEVTCQTETFYKFVKRLQMNKASEAQPVAVSCYNGLY